MSPSHPTGPPTGRTGANNSRPVDEFPTVPALIQPELEEYEQPMEHQVSLSEQISGSLVVPQ